MAALGAGVCTQDKIIVWGGSHKNGRSNLGGQQKPYFLQFAHQQADEGEKVYAQACEDYEDGKITPETLNAKLRSMNELSRRYHELSQMWNEGTING